METIKLTTAQALVRFMSQQYIQVDGVESRLVEGVWTIFGHGNVLGMGQALQENAYGLNVYQGRNEQGMAHVATAFARQSRCHKVMACTTSVGPGAANMLTAAATATANNIPLLLLPGDVFATRQPDPVLQQIEQPHDLSISTNDAFKPLCRYFDRINRPEQLMSAAISAFRALCDETNRGAVCLALPQDVQAETYDYPLSFFQKRVYKLRRVKEEAEVIKQAAYLIEQAKKPLIICGGGVKYSIAEESIMALAYKQGIAIAETQAGKGCVPSDFKYNLGGIGVTGTLAANQYAMDCDLVIGIGTRFNDFTTGSKSLFKHPNVKFIAINTASFHTYKLDAYRVIGDAKVCIEAILETLSNTKKGNEALIETLKNDFAIERLRLSNIQVEMALKAPEVTTEKIDDLTIFNHQVSGALVQTNVLAYINQHIAKESIVVGASGSLPGDLQRLWQSSGENNYHVEYGYSCMGYEIAAGLGAKMASPTTPVYVMLGDGSYQMLHSELVTSRQLDKKVDVILFDNAGFGCIHNLQTSQGIPGFMTEFRYLEGLNQGAYMAVDYAANAAAYGIKSYTVHTMEALALALKDAQQQTGSTLIDIKILPKTMTHGYDCWWHVATPSLSQNEAIVVASDEVATQLRHARKY